MANNTNIRLRRSSVPGKIPTTSDLQLGELGLNTFDGKVFFKKNVSGTETVLTVDPLDPYGGNRVYVSVKKGSDTYDGINSPVKTIKKACQIAAGMPKPVSIMVATGDYYEDNPVIIPDNVSIVGDNLRGVIVRPLNNRKDIFRLRNKSYLTGFTFRDALDNGGAPLYTWAYAIAFDDPLDSTTDRTGYTGLPNTKPLITTSPYIQNCSIISFLGGNGALIDGSKVLTPNTPSIQLESENPVFGAAPDQGKSMVANAFTILTFGGTAWRLINESYAQLVSCFEIFCGTAIYCQSGSYASVTNSATNFGRYGLRSVGYNQSSFIFDRGLISQVGIVEGKQAVTVIGSGRSSINHYIARLYNGVTEVTSTFKTSGTVVSFNSATAVNVSSNLFTINSHGLLNGNAVLYDSGAGTIIGGLDDDTIYYVKQITGNTFYLCYDDSLQNIVDIVSVGSGTQTFTLNSEELFVDGIINNHSFYQDIVIPAGGTTYTFNPGSIITGLNGLLTCSGTVYSWTPNTPSVNGTLTVSINYVSQSGSLVQNAFVSGMTVSDHFSPTPRTVTLGACATRSDLYTTQFNLSSTVSGNLVQNFNSLIGKSINLHRPSIINSSSHTFEYVGSGVDYNALPQNGGQTKPKYEQVQDLPGRVYCSATNELGDFVVGPWDPATGRNLITAENRTGNIYFTQKVTVGELSSIKLSLSNVSIDAFSTDIGLGDNELGGASNSRVSTQLATRSFLNNRLGFFIDKTSSTNSVPGAIVQLNSAGKINSDLITQTRTFNNYTVSRPNRRLEIFENVPSVEILSGDLVTETYTNGAVSTFIASGTGTGTNTYANVSTTGGSGSGATFNVVVTAGSYSLTLSATGTNYIVGNSLTIAGTSLGGTSPTNDITVTVTSLSTISNAYVLQSDTISQYLVIDASQTPDFTGITDVHGVISDADGTIDITRGTNGYLTGAINSGSLSVQGAGYSPASGTKIYYDVPLTGGSGSGATADVTITAGKVVSISLIKSGYNFVNGQTLSANYTDLGGTNPTTAFSYTINGVEKRLYVNLTNQRKKFIASSSISEFICDANAPVKTLTNNTFTSFSFNSTATPTGDVDVSADTIKLTTTSLSNGDAIKYENSGNTDIGGLLQGETYYVKVLSTSGGVQTVELYTDYGLTIANKIDITGTSTGTHKFFYQTVNIDEDRIRINSHGFSSGDAVLYTSSKNISGLTSGNYYYVGSVTANAFTLHTAKSAATESINGNTVTPVNLSYTSATGTVTTSISSTTVSGSGTSFTTELSAGDVLYSTTAINGYYTYIGTVSSITNNTTLILTSNANIAISNGFAYVPNVSSTFKKFNIRLVREVNTSAQVYGSVESFIYSGGGTGTVNGSYTNISATGGSGSSATFNVTRNGSGAISSVTVYEYGYNYASGDVLTISSSSIGGGSNLTITLTSVLSNWSALSGANIDASNIISGTIVPSRLGSGTATTLTFLRGDSSWQYAVQKISVDPTSPLSLIVPSGMTGGYTTVSSNSYYYGDLKLSINRVDGSLTGDISNYTNLGVASFDKTFFNVSSVSGTGIAGGVSIKAKTIDALLLNGQPDTYYLNPTNLIGTVPVSKGGTGITVTPNNGQILVGNGATYNATNLAVGANNSLVVTNGTGTLTVDTVQDIRTTASPTFNNIISTSQTVGNTFITDTTITQSQPIKYIADSFNASTYSTTKYLIQVKHNSTNKYHCTEVLLIHDGSNVYLTEYAVLHTGGSLIESIDATINGGLVELYITPTTGNIQSKVSRISLTV